MDKKITFLMVVLAIFAFNLVSCGGSGGGKGKVNNDNDDISADADDEQEFDGELSPDIPATDGTVSDNQATPEYPEDNPDNNAALYKKIEISVRLGDGGAESTIRTARMRSASVYSEVQGVEIDVVIDGAVFTTTPLTRSAADNLVYTGEISIPVNTTVSLQARATSSDGTVLFRGTLGGVVATELNSPAIQIFMQRVAPVEVLPPPNSAPVIQGTLVSDASLAYGQTATVTVTAEDPQDDPLGYLWEVVSVPEGVDTAGLLGSANQQGASFTAPATDGIYTLRVTTSDPSGLSALASLNIYVSETGLDSTPATGIVLSDFPDCVNWGNSTPSCTGSSQIGSINYTNTIPNRIVWNPAYRYGTGAQQRDYSATQLFNMGFRFEWTDTCTGDNFIVRDIDNNEDLSATSGQFVSTFIKRGLASEACQLTLKITNTEGLFQTYQTTLNFSDAGNESDVELDCDSNPANTNPGVRLTCPDVMTSVPQEIRIDYCTTQGNLNILYTFSRMWNWRINSFGNSIYATNYMGSFRRENLLGSQNGSFRVLVVPYSTSISSPQLADIGADGYISADVGIGDLIEPDVVKIEIHGVYPFVSCVMVVDPAIDLNIPADYFGTP